MHLVFHSPSQTPNRQARDWSAHSAPSHANLEFLWTRPPHSVTISITVLVAFLTVRARGICRGLLRLDDINQLPVRLTHFADVNAGPPHIAAAVGVEHYLGFPLEQLQHQAAIAFRDPLPVAVLDLARTHGREVGFKPKPQKSVCSTSTHGVLSRVPQQAVRA